MNWSFSELKKNLKKDTSELKVVKCAVVADSASQLFCMALKGYGYTQGLNLQIWEADYDQLSPTIKDEASELYSFAPDFVIVFHSSKKLLSKFYRKGTGEKISFADDFIRYTEDLADTINSKLGCNIIFLNFPEINDSVFGNYANKTDLSFLYQQRKINFMLMDLARKKANLHICDVSSVQNYISSQKLHNPALYVNTDNVFNLDALPLVAKNVIDIIVPFTGKFKKCLILDLDNTLWGGIIGDDGIENIQIGELGIGKAFTEFQKWIKQLQHRGIILAVSSKNTESIARDAFENHPDMILRMDDFAVFAVNWNNKADNIRYIQSVLNIGFDSMVFLDDNPFERAMVKTHIADITVPELPEDPAEYLPYLYTQNLFETISFTEEDIKRTKQYQEEAHRTVLQQSFVNEDEFLLSLQMTAVVKPIDKFTLPRAAQLTQRSNQFNLRTVRYSEEQMKQVVDDKEKYSLTISLKDKFGDYGLISLLILEKRSDEELFIDTWIMSCRVLKRGVENFVTNELVGLAQENNIKFITGEYLPTPKNGIVKDHYLNLGFIPKENIRQLNTNEYQLKKTFIKKEA
ncbi:HAD-IIIC family phosphatase [soil metagenome]